MADQTERLSGKVSRRSLLHGAVCAGGAAAILAVTANRAAAKMAKGGVGYTDSSAKNGQSCSNCAPFEPPNGCRIVDGTISPKGWCKVWQRKS